MTKTEKLNDLIKLSNGYLYIADAEKLGISKVYIREYVIANNLERVAHGLYKSSDVWTDDLYILTFNNKKAVYSFDTALMLNGLTEREPSEIFVTVSRSYNASHLRSKGIIVNYVKDEWLDLGRTVAKTVYGNEVSVYDMERTICDIIRVRDKKDPQMFTYAIKEYAKSANKNLPRLMKYAKEFGVEAELRKYMEVLL
jgi:predicted transcriptional regulator of viral defense system